MARFLFLFLILGFFSSALASETVQFANQELSAVLTLMRPELNSLELQGRRAIYTPSPSMKYLGAEAETIPLDLTVIANIVDLEFNHIKTKAPEVKFENGFLQLRLPVEDQSKAVRSNLGSISFKNVAILAQFGWNTKTNGEQELGLQKISFQGTLNGTGILRSNFILNKTREFCVSELKKTIQKFLTQEKFQTSVHSGLIEYGKFYTGKELKETVPGSIQLFTDGIKFQAN